MLTSGINLDLHTALHLFQLDNRFDSQLRPTTKVTYVTNKKRKFGVDRTRVDIFRFWLVLISDCQQVESQLNLS